jgi:hypothetical protein
VAATNSHRVRFIRAEASAYERVRRVSREARCTGATCRGFP